MCLTFSKSYADLDAISGIDLIMCNIHFEAISQNLFAFIDVWINIGQFLLSLNTLYGCQGSD